MTAGVICPVCVVPLALRQTHHGLFLCPREMKSERKRTDHLCKKTVKPRSLLTLMFPSWVLRRGRKGKDCDLVAVRGCGGWYLDGMSGRSDISDLNDILSSP